MSEPPQHDQLDPRRIRSIQLERQAIYRARTFQLIFGIALVVAAAQLIFLMYRNLQAGDSNTQAIGALELFISLILFAIGCLLLAKAHHLNHELKKSHLLNLPTPPDFSALNNGSQFADHLATMSTASENLDPDILNITLDLALNWGDEFMQPTQTRLKAIYDHLTEAELDAYDEEARAAMKVGHSTAGGEFDIYAIKVRAHYPWVSTDNLQRMFSQGNYFANK